MRKQYIFFLYRKSFLISRRKKTSHPFELKLMFSKAKTALMDWRNFRVLSAVFSFSDPRFLSLLLTLYSSPNSYFHPLNSLSWNSFLPCSDLEFTQGFNWLRTELEVYTSIVGVRRWLLTRKPEVLNKQRKRNLEPYCAFKPIDSEGGKEKERERRTKGDKGSKRGWGGILYHSIGVKNLADSRFQGPH